MECSPDVPRLRSSELASAAKLGNGQPVRRAGQWVRAAGVVVAAVVLAGLPATVSGASGTTTTTTAAGTSKSGGAGHNTSKGGTAKPVAPTATHRVTFGIAPSSASGPDGRSSYNIGATPGGVVYDNVALVNYSTLPLTLGLTATDGVQTAGGGFGLLPPSATPTVVGAWISLPPGATTVQVPPKSITGAPGTVVVPFTVHVPAKAAPGDHAGALVASLKTVGQNSTGQRIILYQRVGARVYIQVSGKLDAHLVVNDLHASYRSTLNPFGRGSAVVTYTLRNTGNVDLAVDQTVGVSQVIGSTRTVQAPGISLLLPGSSVAEKIVVARVWPQFLLHATVTAQGRAPAASGLKPVSVTASTTVWAIPWSPIVLVVLIVLAWLAVWRYRGRRRRLSAGGGAGDGDHVDEGKEVVR